MKIFKETTGWILTILLLDAMLPVASMAQNGENSYKASAEIEKQVIEWRRDFHEHPELSNREFRTGKTVAEYLRSLGMEVTEGIVQTGVNTFTNLVLDYMDMYPDMASISKHE